MMPFSSVVKVTVLEYASVGWTTTNFALQRRGHSPATLEAAGLARRTSAGRLIDVFRDRLIFPLTDVKGASAIRPDLEPSLDH